MNLRRHMGLVIGLGVALVLFLAAAGFLFRYQMAYKKVKKDLDRQERRLQGLMAEKPFPSEANIKGMQEKLEVLSDFESDYLAALREGQPVPVDIEAAEFPSMLEKSVRELVNLAEGHVILPERFAFGFRRYFEGALPSQDDIERLVVQLKMMDRLTRVLFAAGIDEIREIERDVFEEDDKQAQNNAADLRRTARRGSRQTDRKDETANEDEKQNGLYQKESFSITFTARESSFWDVMDEMVGSDLFVIVKKVTLEGSRPDLAAARQNVLQLLAEREAARMQGAAPGGGRGANPGSEKEGFAKYTGRRNVRWPTHEERVVAGREDVVVKLDLDVYRFPVQQDEESTQ